MDCSGTISRDPHLALSEAGRLLKVVVPTERG